MTQNLALGVSDPEGADPSTFAYSVGTVPDGISASVSGSTLTVSAAQDTARGQAGSIAVSVTDADGNSVSGSVPVEVVASSKPAVSVSDYRTRARVGETVRVDVASQAVNPFPGSPLTIEGAVLGMGSARVHTEGTVVSITPDEVGTIKVTYRINDYLRDPSRSAQGNITVTVISKPNPPTNLRAEPRGTSGARLTFSVGADNGSSINGYRVHDADTGQQVSATCKSGSCAVDGLSAGRSYAFYVVATSSEGDSESSAVSNRITTVGKPSQMVAPSVIAGDSVLKVSWVAPASNGGSDIDHYELQINGDEATSYTTTSATVPVVNGHDYAVRVRAVNREREAGPWSSPTIGRPRPSHVAPDEPVVTVTTERWEGQGVIVAKVFVSWTVGSSGGSGWGQTTITVNGEPHNVTANEPQPKKVVLEDSVTTATVTVTVRNIEGDATTSTPQTVRIPPNPNTPPFEIAPPTITATGNSGQLLVTNANVKPGRGYLANELTVFWGKSGAECADKARANDVNRKVQGTNFVWDGGPGIDGVEQAFYFCQISTSGLVSSSIRVNGTPRNDHAVAPVPPDKDWANIPIDADYASYPDGGFAVGIRRTKEIDGLCTYGCRLKVVGDATGKLYAQSDAVVSPTDTPALRVHGSELPVDEGYRVALHITLSTREQIIKYMH